MKTDFAIGALEVRRLDEGVFGRMSEFVGKRYGRLIVIKKDDNRKNSHDIYWICRCDCGNEKSVSTGHLNSGTVKSCGCLKKEIAREHFRIATEKNTRHGEAGTKLYGIWHCMKERCENEKIASYKWYGAKGIKVCEEWQDYKNFSKWANENGYSDYKGVERKNKLSIDRINSNGDYCPENCRWITVSENTRRGSIKRWENEKRNCANRSSGTKDVI